VNVVLAEITKPAKAQTTLKRGTATIKNGIRTVIRTEAEYQIKNHSIVTYYEVPFHDGTFSLSWNLDREQKIALVFNGKPDGTATHLFKVFINGHPTKRHLTDVVSLVTYDGSTKKKKKAQITTKNFHAVAGK